MSQEKVNRYKKEKANRKEIVKKEKRLRIVEITAAIVIAVAALGWFGYSVYQNAQPEKTVNVETDYTELESYLNGLTLE